MTVESPATHPPQRGAPEPAAAGGLMDGFDPHRIIASFRRRLSLFIIVAAVVLGVIVTLTLRAPRQYTAYASVVLETRQPRVTDAQAVLAGLPADAGMVDTEVEVLRSRQLAARVVDMLRLTSQPEFGGVPQASGAAPIAEDPAAAGLTGSPPDAATMRRERIKNRVINQVLGRLNVRRAGLTNVITIGFTSLDRQTAAAIANAYADAYLVDQLESKFEATRQANQWLSSRLNDLRNEVQIAETAVERYKTANNLLSAQGATLTEQEISAFNQQLAAARQTQAEEEARLRTAKAQLAGGSTGEDVGEALGSAVIQSLRAQRATVSGRVADLQGRYGPRHPEMLKAQRELADIDAQIQSEIQRIVSNLEARAQVARERTASVQSSLGGARTTLAGNNAASVRLKELERNAESARTLYESYMNRFRETSSQEGLARPDARIVSRAVPPGVPSSPKIGLSVAIGLVLAFGAGLGSIILAEMLDSGLATADELERRLGVRSLGSVPHLRSIAARADRRTPPVDDVLKKPLSGFAEAVRALRTSVLYPAGGETVRVVAVTSALPSEGKTTTSVCLARASAHAGARVAIVDCDLRRRKVTSLLAAGTDGKGLLEVLAGEATLDEVLTLDKPSGAYLVPLSRGASTAFDLFATPEMEQLLDDLAERFELVVLDTAPALAVAETRVLAARADAVIVLARWRRTPYKAVDAALKVLENAGAKVAGVALTQVDMRKQSRYGYGDPGFYYAEYKNYYAQ